MNLTMRTPDPETAKLALADLGFETATEPVELQFENTNPLDGLAPIR